MKRILSFLALSSILAGQPVAAQEDAAGVAPVTAPASSAAAKPASAESEAEPQSVPQPPTAGDKWRELLGRTAERSAWKKNPAEGLVVDAEVLDEAIEAARSYYLGAQLPAGNFRYGLDITNDEPDTADNQVRQAGALWGLSNLNRDRFTEPTRRAVILGLDFFMRNMQQPPASFPKVITYRSGKVVKTGTVALFCLALTDFLEGQERYLPEQQRIPYMEALETNLKFLQAMELPDGSWREEFNAADALDGNLCPDSSPYYDGEALLAYLCALRFYNARPAFKAPKDLDKRVDEAIPLLIRKYVVDALLPGGNQEKTKGFCQWGMMSFALYFASHEGETASAAADAAMTLAWWQIYANTVEYRVGNTAYAVEGLLAAWDIAQRRGRTEDAVLLRETILRVLGNLLLCQIGGPFEEHNPYLLYWKPHISARTHGGIISSRDYGFIRIDNVQHQLHAMLLARRLLFGN